MINNFRQVKSLVFFSTAGSVEKMIFERFDRKIRLIDDQECGNYVKKYYELKIEDKDHADFTEKEVNDWLNGNSPNNNLWHILQYLVNKKELLEGGYIIDLSW